MATRRDIREAFYSHLESTVSGLVPADNIGQDEPETEEDFPAIVHNDDYRKVPLNDGSSGPTDIIYDNNGEVAELIYSSYHEASFGVAIFDTDEQRKEDIYEAVRSYFEKFEERPWPVSDIQADAEWIDVLDSTSQDDTDASPHVRGDRLIIRLGFARTHSFSDFSNIHQVDHLVDGGDDGTTDEITSTT